MAAAGVPSSKTSAIMPQERPRSLNSVLFRRHAPRRPGPIFSMCCEAKNRESVHAGLPESARADRHSADSGSMTPGLTRRSARNVVTGSCRPSSDSTRPYACGSRRHSGSTGSRSRSSRLDRRRCMHLSADQSIAESRVQGKGFLAVVVAMHRRHCLRCSVRNPAGGIRLTAAVRLISLKSSRQVAMAVRVGAGVSNHARSGTGTELR